MACDFPKGGFGSEPMTGRQSGSGSGSQVIAETKFIDVATSKSEKVQIEITDGRKYSKNY